MIKYVLFDLDGTLLPMDEKKFESEYFKSLHEAVNEYFSLEDLVKIIWSCTKEMVLNTEDLTNEEVFYAAFKETVKEPLFSTCLPLFNQYYEENFDRVKPTTWVSQPMIDAVNRLKEKGYQVHITTNPMFPKVAIDKRIAWTGINREHFSSVTYFEESHFCKPQIQYYQEVLTKHQLDPKEGLMVGNNDLEDLIAGKLGLETYLIEDCLITNEKSIEPTHRGSYETFKAYVETMPDLKKI